MIEGVQSTGFGVQGTGGETVANAKTANGLNASPRRGFTRSRFGLVFAQSKSFRVRFLLIGPPRRRASDPPGGRVAVLYRWILGGGDSGGETVASAETANKTTASGSY